MKYLLVPVTILVLVACCTAQVTHRGSRSVNSAKVFNSEVKKTPIDSLVQFLLTSAASDFNLHGPSGNLHFRKVRIGHIIIPDGQKQYMLCGQFRLAIKEVKPKWTPFVTLKTSGYEQILGDQARSYCKSSAVIWDKAGDLTSQLQSMYNSFQ